MTFRDKSWFDWPGFRYRVSRGAFLLDQIDSEWAERIDLRGFVMPIAIHAGVEVEMPEEPSWSMRQIKRLIEKATDRTAGCCPTTGPWSVGFACCDPHDCAGLTKAWRRKIAQRQRIAGERCEAGRRGGRTVVSRDSARESLSKR